MSTDTPDLDRYSRAGHDRDCLRAMWSQAAHGQHSLGPVQVEHLLRIAWTAGATAEHEAIHEGITEDCRPLFDYAKALAQTGNSGDRFIRCVVRAYGPTLPWRDRLRLGVYLVFRKGYAR